MCYNMYILNSVYTPAEGVGIHALYKVTFEKGIAI